jgi:hypothetical protein
MGLPLTLIMKTTILKVIETTIHRHPRLIVLVMFPLIAKPDWTRLRQLDQQDQLRAAMPLERDTIPLLLPIIVEPISLLVPLKNVNYHPILD